MTRSNLHVPVSDGTGVEQARNGAGTGVERGRNKRGMRAINAKARALIPGLLRIDVYGSTEP